jgi:hypothetical protein
LDFDYSSNTPPDASLVASDARPNDIFVVFGGAKFAVDSANSLGLNLANVHMAPATFVDSLSTEPLDGTLLREGGNPRVYVVYGGAKFWIPNPAALSAMGFNFIEVNVVPPGSLAGLGGMPRPGTLLKELSDPKVFLARVVNVSAGLLNKLCWVTSPAVFDSNCLSWRNLRVVPDVSLSSLSRGPDIT